MVVRVVQFTDTHLFASREGTLKGVFTYETLKSVAESARGECEKADFLVLTGDISQDETAQSYEHVGELVYQLNERIFYIPGNHDSKSAMIEGFRRYDHINCVRSVEMGSWLFIFLDSLKPGCIEGDLSESELAHLSEELDKNDGDSVAIFLHHNIVNLNPSRVDQMMLQNADRFLTLLAPYKNVKAVICGHVHQDFQKEMNGFDFISTPSTCIQFLPSDTGVKLDVIPPGFRTLEFRDDGTFITEVRRLDTIPDGLKVTTEDL